MKKYLKHNATKPRAFGISTKPCRICGRFGAHIGQYGLDVCRQCFREHAVELGFRKYC